MKYAGGSSYFSSIVNGSVDMPPLASVGPVMMKGPRTSKLCCAAHSVFLSYRVAAADHTTTECFLCVWGAPTGLRPKYSVENSVKKSFCMEMTLVPSLEEMRIEVSRCAACAVMMVVSGGRGRGRALSKHSIVLSERMVLPVYAFLR